MTRNQAFDHFMAQADSAATAPEATYWALEAFRHALEPGSDLRKMVERHIETRLWAPEERPLT